MWMVAEHSGMFILDSLSAFFFVLGQQSWVSRHLRIRNMDRPAGAWIWSSVGAEFVAAWSFLLACLSNIIISNYWALALPKPVLLRVDINKLLVIPTKYTKSSHQGCPFGVTCVAGQPARCRTSGGHPLVRSLTLGAANPQEIQSMSTRYG